MSQGVFPGLGPPDGWPQSDEDWFAKKLDVNEVFDPVMPVRETELFAGRTSQMEKLIDTIYQAGQHVVVYGDRGVGKTSLINIVRIRIFANAKHKKFFPTPCFESDDYVRIWERALKKHQWPNGEWAVDDIDDTVGPDAILDIIARFKENESPVIIFDEFDRIDDEDTKIKMAETIKLFADSFSHSTIIIAGVGKTITDLISKHESIRRHIKQIEMPRMNAEEILELLYKRLSRLNMSMDDEVLKTIVWLAHGMPGYAQLLGKYSAHEAIDARRMSINHDHLFASLAKCLEETFESTRHAYSLATQSTQPNNTLKHTLLACAVAPQDEFGRFTASSVRNPLSKIMERERTIPDYSRHLKQFCSKERGPILSREGTPKNYHYSFIDPLMQSYIITRGVTEQMLRPETN